MAEDDADRDEIYQDEDTIDVDSMVRQTFPGQDPSLQSAFLIVLAGNQVGELYRVGEGLLVGRAPEAGIQVLDSGVSKRHLRVFAHQGEMVVEDLGSRNGTFVNGKRIVQRTRLADGDKIHLGSTTILKFSVADALEATFQQRMYQAAICDPLTGLFNRRRLTECLQTELAYAIRHNTKLSLIMIDLDHFKRLNDTHGHPAGDTVLRRLAAQIMDCIRREDMGARYGGEEFAIVCRGVAAKDAAVLAERLRARVEKEPLLPDLPELLVTISAGVADGPRDGVTEPETLIEAADRALYEAKRHGRNRVCIG